MVNKLISGSENLNDNLKLLYIIFYKLPFSGIQTFLPDPNDVEMIQED